MRIFRDPLILLIMAVGVVFTVAMVFNLIGAARIIQTLYHENNSLFWVVIGGYIAIAVAVIAVRLRQRASARRKKH